MRGEGGGAFDAAWIMQNLANLNHLAMTLGLGAPPEDSQDGVVQG